MSKWEELEKAARAATPGPWVADRGEVWGTHPMRFNLTTGGTPMIAKMCEHQDSERPFPFVKNAAYIAAANPSAILELLAERDALQSENLEHCRLLGISAERELKLVAELDALKAELDRIKSLEPVVWANPNGGFLSDSYMKNFATGLEKQTHTVPLYTLEKP